MATAVERGLLLGSYHQVSSAQHHVLVGLAESANYQHIHEGLEEDLGHGMKKRKGIGLATDLNEEASASLSLADVTFMGGPGGMNKKKKNQKYKPHQLDSSKGNHSERDQEDTRRRGKAAVVRQKPPL
ncbi:unnamed protein product [Linum trigynum]|uniref:Uncharacterized protein n=1 Tax=Linum trigynum TaxID=586398 RepID=A0AAV2CDI8_9ROSI